MKKTTTFSLSKEILEKLETYCENEGPGKSFVVEKALFEYFNNLFSETLKIKMPISKYDDWVDLGPISFKIMIENEASYISIKSTKEKTKIKKVSLCLTVNDYSVNVKHQETLELRNLDNIPTSSFLGNVFKNNNSPLEVELIEVEK